MKNKVKLEHRMKKTIDKLVYKIAELDKLSLTDFNRFKVISFREKLQELQEIILEENKEINSLSSIYLEDKRREQNACNDVYKER